jgi:ATP-dependent DNA helicase RecQ
VPPHPDQILQDVFGYASFRPGQEEVMNTILAGENVLVVMPTGAGKSLCFQIPALARDALTIVVSPLVALMEDQVAALRLAGVAAETINSSRDYNVNAASWRRVAAGETRLLYISPERLMTDRMLAALSRLPVMLLVVDEAHCISRWGPSFRPEYEGLSRISAIFPDASIAAFTATADAATRDDIAGKLFNGQGRIFVAGFDRPNIRLAVEPRGDWKQQLLAFVKDRAGESGIVYCLSRKKTEEAATFLCDNDVRALPYHAGMESGARNANQEVFMTEAGAVMTATIAFGMGIDKPDVRYVFHANLPGNMESYYQELGRAGRDGAAADAFMLYGLDDIRQRRFFIEDDNGDDAHKRREHKRLDSLIAYCETPTCRRRTLLSYFGEDPEPCGNCDVCLDPPALSDGREPGAAVANAVRETGQRFGAAHIVDVVRGANTEKIRSLGHERLNAYGAGSSVSKDNWRSIIRQMVAAGLLNLDYQGHGGLSLTPHGEAFSRGEADFRYRKHPARTTAKQGRQTTKSAEAATLSAPETELLAALKRLRLDLARERGVPAFAVFADRALIDMARRKPQTNAEFLAVNGVGAAKLRDFAEPFMAAISEQLDQQGAG